jgi:hypothetical protein
MQVLGENQQVNHSKERIRIQSQQWSRKKYDWPFRLLATT